MLSIFHIIYETCCAGWRPKEPKIINRILHDMEDLAEEEVERLLRHIALRKSSLSCCG